jgi:hypothetical protein
MTEHKATLGQWNADRYDWARADTEAMDGDSAFRCIMELRARVEALELWRATTATASADNSRISRRPWAAMSYRGVMLLPPIDCADPDLWIADRIYEMGLADGKKATTGNTAQQKATAKPATRLHSYRVENSALPIEEWGKGHTIVDSAKPAESNCSAEPDSSLAEETCNAFVQTCKANSPTKPENETSAKPDSSLVEQVAIVCAMPAKWTWDDQARAVIHTIADWFDQKWMLGAAKRLRQEVE